MERRPAPGPLRPRLRQAPSAGFSLLEVLVAITVLAVGLGIVYQTLGTGARAAGSGDGYSRAALYAQSILAGVDAEYPLEEGETTGRFPDSPDAADYRWRMVITPYVDAAGEPISDGPVEVLSVMTEVTWGRGGQERSLHLDTVRLRPRL